jgi:O-antigen/teichoic acid export membrane protein
MNQAWTRFLPAALRAKIEGHHYLQNLITNTGWLFAEHVLRMAIGLVVGIWVARYLGPEQFGLLSYAFAFVFVFSSFAMLGLEWVVVRTLVREPARRTEILGTAFLLKLIAGAATLALSFGAVVFLRPGDRLTWALVGVIALGNVFNASGVISFWFQSEVQAKFTTYAKSAASLSGAALKVALISSQAPLVAFAWVALAESLVGSLGLVAAYRWRGQRLREWRVTGTMAKQLLRDSWPLLLADVVVLAYLRIDQVMLGQMGDPAEMGIYSVAVILAEVWYFIPMAVATSVFPGVVAARESGEQTFYEQLQKYYKLMAFLAYAVAVPVTLVGNQAVALLFGPSYAAAGPMLIGLVWAGLFVNLSIARSSFLVAQNWNRLHALADLLGLLVNVGLNLVLIPEYGGNGAVVASILGYWMAAHGSSFVFKPLRRTGTMLTKAILWPRFW